MARTRSKDNEIRSRPTPNCNLCSIPGQPLYQGLKDCLFTAPGLWNLKRCPNPECGLVWLDPMPLEEDIGKAYRTYYTHNDPTGFSDSLIPRARQSIYRFLREGYLSGKYGYPSSGWTKFKRFSSMPLYLLPANHAGFDLSVMRLPCKPDGHLLDVGCGNGKFLDFMRGLGWKVEGVDLDPVAVDAAREKGLTVRCGNLTEQSYSENYFDAVTMSHLIEHVHDPRSLIKKCHGILKPGGRLTIITPNIRSFGHSLFKSSWRGLEPPRHLHIFSLKSFSRLAEETGFMKFKIWTTFHLAPFFFIASRNIETRGFSPVDVRSEPISVWLWGRKMQLLEWFSLLKSPHLGEEIVFEGIK